MVTRMRRTAVARLTRNETIATNIACIFFGASAVCYWGDENENVRRRRKGK